MTNQPHTLSVEPTARHTDVLWEITDVAKYLRCTTRTVKRRMKYEGLPFKRVGPRAVRFRQAEIDQWIEAQQQDEAA